jgi:hypothetical protein
MQEAVLGRDWKRMDELIDEGAPVNASTEGVRCGIWNFRCTCSPGTSLSGFYYKRGIRY